MTFGVRPTEPATGYGYIRAAGPGVAGVAGFTEKPARELAEQYLQAGDYYWNSGMFMFRAGAFLDALAEFAPDMLAACREAFENLETDPDFVRIPEAVFARCPADSIDYAVMEKTSKAMVVPLDAGWSDLGSWRSLWEVGTRDADGNVLLGDVVTHRAAGCYIRAESRLVAAVGVDDRIIVETADAVLVAHKDRSEDIKQLVEQLRERGRPEVDRSPGDGPAGTGGGDNTARSGKKPVPPA
jgi:mannose-1-phosphate guanylyltransferase/mannose-1-phosphate guanylyltransferase/mannose-6-phosphate isomerase